MIRVLVLVMLMFSGVALARESEAKKFFNAAVALYENLEYELALKQLAKARGSASNPSDMAKIALLEGVVLADMGRKEKALTAFKTGFGIDVDAKIPVVVGPKTSELAEQARTNVRKILNRQRESEGTEAQAIEAEPAPPLKESPSRPPEPEPTRIVPTETVQQPVSARTNLRRLAWIPAAGALILGGLSTWMFISAAGKQSALLSGTVDAATALKYRNAGPTEVLAADIFAVAGGVGVVAAVVMFVVGKPAAVAVVPMPNGSQVTMAFAFFGEFP